MIIDWYTIIFQIVNFLILVFLLRYFLYGPIIRTMDEREQTIMRREEEAAAQKLEAENESRSYLQKSEELQQQEEEILEKARAAAKNEKQELLEQARREVDEARHRWKEELTRERETFINELRQRIGQQACLIARRCLQDLADSYLEELIWDFFLKKIGELPEEECASLLKASVAGDHKVLLRSAFDTPEAKLNELKKDLQKIVNDPEAGLHLSVKKDPALICGLELEVGGYRIAWSIENYLEDVEEQILKELEQTAPAKQAEEVPGSGERGS